MWRPAICDEGIVGAQEIQSDVLAGQLPHCEWRFMHPLELCLDVANQPRERSEHVLAAEPAYLMQAAAPNAQDFSFERT